MGTECNNKLIMYYNDATFSVESNNYSLNNENIILLEFE